MIPTPPANKNTAAIIKQHILGRTNGSIKYWFRLLNVDSRLKLKCKNQTLKLDEIDFVDPVIAFASLLRSRLFKKLVIL